MDDETFSSWLVGWLVGWLVVCVSFALPCPARGDGRWSWLVGCVSFVCYLRGASEGRSRWPTTVMGGWLWLGRQTRGGGTRQRDAGLGSSTYRKAEHSDDGR